MIHGLSRRRGLMRCTVALGAILAAAPPATAHGGNAPATEQAAAPVEERQSYVLRLSTQVHDGRRDVSHSQIMGLGRVRQGDYSLTQFDFGDGAVVIDGGAGLSVGRFLNVSGAEKAVLYNYRDQSIEGSSDIARFHNAHVRPWLGKAPPLGRDARWTQHLPVAALGLEGIAGGDLRVELSRAYFVHDGQPMVLTQYAVPAFAYDAGGGRQVVQWGRGVALTDPGFGMIWLNAILHRAVASDRDGASTPYRYGRMMVAANPDGSAMLDYRTVPQVAAVIDDYVGAEVMRVVPTRGTDGAADDLPIQLARNLDLIALSLGENGANEVPAAAAAQSSPDRGLEILQSTGASSQSAGLTALQSQLAQQRTMLQQTGATGGADAATRTAVQQNVVSDHQRAQATAPAQGISTVPEDIIPGNAQPVRLRGQGESAAPPDLQAIQSQQARDAEMQRAMAAEASGDAATRASIQQSVVPDHQGARTAVAPTQGANPAAEDIVPGHAKPVRLRGQGESAASPDLQAIQAQQARDAEMQRAMAAEASGDAGTRTTVQQNVVPDHQRAQTTTPAQGVDATPDDIVPGKHQPVRLRGQSEYAALPGEQGPDLQAIQSRQARDAQIRQGMAAEASGDAATRANMVQQIYREPEPVLGVPNKGSTDTYGIVDLSKEFKATPELIAALDLTKLYGVRDPFAEVAGRKSDMTFGAQDESPDAIAQRDTATRKAEAQAALDARYEADRKAKGLPALDSYATPEERRAAYAAQLQDYQTQKLAEIKAVGGDGTDSRRLSTLATAELLTSAFDIQPVTFTPVTFDADGDLFVRDENGNTVLRKVGPDDFRMTPFDPPKISSFPPTDPRDLDGYPGTGQYPAFGFDSMSGTVQTDLTKWAEWLATQDVAKLEKLALQAGYPNLASALEDAENIIRLAENDGYRKWAMQAPSCGGYVGCGPAYLGQWGMKRSTLALGDILKGSRDVFSTGGFSDIGISGLNLAYILADTGVQDGDLVSIRITQFGRAVYSLASHYLTNAGTRFNTALRPGVAELVITALNEGDLTPNTAGVSIENVVRGNGTQGYSLATGQTATLRIEAGAKATGGRP